MNRLGTIIACNKLIEKIFGFGKEKLIGKNFTSLLEFLKASISPKFFEQRFQKVENREFLEPIEFCINNENNTPIWVGFTNSIIKVKNIHYLLGIFQDISAKKKVEIALKQDKAKLEGTLRAAPIGIGVEVDRIIIDVNELFCELTGYSREELLNQDAKFLYPSLEEYERVGMEKKNRLNKSSFETNESQLKRKDGKIIDVLMSASRIDKDDSSLGTAFTVLDITDRKNAERALKISEEKYRHLFESSPFYILLLDKDWNIIDCNSSIKIILRYSKE